MRSRKRPVALGLGERCDEIGERGEVRRCWPAFTASTAEAVARWLLPVPGGPRRCTTSARSMNFELGQRQDAVAIERGLEGEVEAGERLDRGEARHQERCLDAAVLAQGEFLDQELVEGPDAVDLALLDAPQGGIEHFECARHPEPDEAALDAVDRCGGSVGHERPPIPPARCSPMA